MTATRIILFAKAPLPGFAKTRLAAVLGDEGAARVARRLLDHALREATEAAVGRVEPCVTPAPDDPAWAAPREDWPDLDWTDQGGGDLGQIMARAAQRGLARGTPVILMGSDCPALGRARLIEAARALADHDMVMNPASDGGYVLLGLRRFSPELFTGIAWSTATVAAETLQCAARLQWRYRQLETLHDIDDPVDLEHLPPEFLAAAPQSTPPIA